MRIEIRRRASRRSVSSWDSPGPRVPTPPPSRSRCCHMPRMRGRLYSSCASSTWSLPSALTGVLGEDVEDQLRAVDDARLRGAFSSVRCWDGRSSSSTTSTSAPAAGVALLQLVELALADVRARVGVRPVLDEAADRAHAGGPRELLELGQLLVGIDSLREDGQDEPALGLEARRRIGLSHCHSHVIMTRTVPTPDLAAQNARARRRSLGEPARGGCDGARPRLSLGEPLYDDGEVAPLRATRRRPSCSPATWTPFPRRGTCPAGSRTAPSTASARAT